MGVLRDFDEALMITAIPLQPHDLTKFSSRITRFCAWPGKAPKCSVYSLSHEDRHRENFLDAASWLLAGIPDCYDDAIRF